MNSETLLQVLQNGFRVTLGATASLVEVLQDPQKREENLAKLKQEWSQLAEEWAAKGEITEQDARNFVNDFFSQRSNPDSSAPPKPTSSTDMSAPTAPSDVQVELQDLTAKIATIRAELEKLRNAE